MTDEDDGALLQSDPIPNVADLLEKCRRLGRQKVICRADQITTLVQIGQAALRDQAALIERLRTERDAAWQPIETAPTDGTTVLVYAPAYDAELPEFQCTAAYHPDGGWCVDELREPTHWRPLPEPPESKP